jgi:hypothetical protein
MNDQGEYAANIPRWRRMRPVVLGGVVALWAGWVACAVALLLIILYDVESVLVTGPIIAILGLVAVALGIGARFSLVALLGVANCSICLLFFGLVLTLGWSPADADAPFAGMGLVFTVSTLPAVLRATRRAPATLSPWICARCGYLLYGLSEARCPECGTPFDPSLLNSETPPRVGSTADGTGPDDATEPPSGRVH